MANELTDDERFLGNLFYAIWCDTGDTYPCMAATVHPATASEPRWMETWHDGSGSHMIVVFPERAADAANARKFGLQKASALESGARVMLVSIEDVGENND